MNQSNYTRSRLSARTIISQIARFGHVTREHLAECVAIDDKSAIIDLIARLGYLTEAHIAACTGITENLDATLRELCLDDRLRPIDVAGFDVLYWLRPDGLSEVGEIEIPGVGVVEPAAMKSRERAIFCTCRVSDPTVMAHTLAVADLAVALYRTYNSLILGERMLRLAEKLARKRIGTARRRCPDVVAVSPSGEVTVYESECTRHSEEEGIATARGWDESDHVARVIYLAYGQPVHTKVKRCLERADVGNRLILLSCRGRHLPHLEALRPAGAGRRHRAPDHDRKRRAANTYRTDHPRPHHQSGPPRSKGRVGSTRCVRS